MTRICKECVHFSDSVNGPAVCMRGAEVFDPVYGVRPVFVGVCRTEREPASWLEIATGRDDKCGPEGKHFASLALAAKQGTPESLSALDANLGVMTAKPLPPDGWEQ